MIADLERSTRGTPGADSGPTRVRYMVLLLLCSLAFLTYLDRICIMRVQEEIERDLNLRQLTAEDEALLQREGKQEDPVAREKMSRDRATERMAWVFAAFLWGYVLLEVPAGWMGDRWGPRAIIVRIVICWSVFTALTGSVKGLATLALVRFLFGLGEAGAYPNIGRALARWFPFQNRASAQGAIWMSSRLGGALAPAIIGALTALPGGWGGWRNSFWILGGIGIAWAFFFHFAFRDRPEDNPSANQAERELIRSGAAEAGSIYDDRRHVPVPWRRILLSPNLLSIYLTAAAVSFSWYFCVTFLPRYLEEEFGVRYQDSEIMSGLPLLFGGLSSLVGGRLSDFLIRKTGSKRWGRSLPGVLGFGVAALCALSIPQLGTAWGVIALLSIASAFQDLAIPCIWSLPADVGGRYAGTVGGCMNTVGALGGALSPLVAARVAAAHGWNLVFLVFAASYFLGALLWLRIDASEPILRPEREGVTG